MDTIGNKIVNAIWLLAFLLGIAAAAVFVNRAAKRYGAQRVTDGEWDENGPKHPTAPKPWEHVSSMGYIGLHLDDELPAPEPTRPPESHEPKHRS